MKEDRKPAADASTIKIKQKENTGLFNWPIYEKLSNYEKEVEDVAPTSPATKGLIAKCPATKPVARHSGCQNTISYRPCKGLTAIVIHGIRDTKCMGVEAVAVCWHLEGIWGTGKTTLLRACRIGRLANSKKSDTW